MLTSATAANAMPSSLHTSSVDFVATVAKPTAVAGENEGISRSGDDEFHREEEEAGEKEDGNEEDEEEGGQADDTVDMTGEGIAPICLMMSACTATGISSACSAASVDRTELMHGGGDAEENDEGEEDP